MKKINGKIKICLIIIFIIFAINIFIKLDNRKGQLMDQLSYDIKLNEDGSMNVVETWDIHVSKTNTLFRNFGIDSSKYNISNVKVKDLTKGIDLTQIYEEQYHVDTDCYYGLNVDYSQFEIAWGTGLEEKTKDKIYEISYTVNNVINDYKDCQEFYWKLLDKSNGIPCKKIVGTIKLPKEVQDIENLKVWGHGEINGEIKRESKDTVSFNIKDLPSGSMLELRTVNLDKIYNISNEENIKAYNELENILREENKWANDTNAKIESSRKVLGIFGGIYLIFLVFGIFKIRKYWKISQKDGTGIESKKLEYFRDIPRDGQSTPGEAAILYFFKENYQLKGGVQSDVIAATILDLCLKKCISLRVEEESVYVEIINENIELKKDEKAVLDLLKNVANKRKEFEIKELKTYAKKEFSDFAGKVNGLVVNAKKNLYEEGLIDKKKEKEYNFASRSGIWGILMIITFAIIVYVLMCNIPIFKLQYASMFGIGIFRSWKNITLILMPALIEFYLLYEYTDRCISKITALTQKGKDEEVEWKALAKFMRNYSMLDEKGVPDLVLWEKYLVFSTAFGISEKVIEQLKARYPYVFTDEYWETNDADDPTTILNVLVRQNTISFNYTISHISSTVESANKISAAEMASYYSSSGGGGGGGFSSGGGGRRRRWPEWEEDKEAL